MEPYFCLYFVDLGNLLSRLFVCGYSSHWGEDIKRESISVPTIPGTLNINHIAFENGSLVLPYSQKSYHIFVF